MLFSVHSIVKLAVDENGNRLPHLEKQIEKCFKQCSGTESADVDLHMLENILERELHHRNIVKAEQAYSAKLIALACC